MSSAFHPQTNGASERSNKTVIQLLRFYVDRQQKGWVAALPRIHFELMNSVNKSTGFSPFQLRLGHSPRVLPPLPIEPLPQTVPEEAHAVRLLHQLELDCWEAQDNLLLAKVCQASSADRSRGPEHSFKLGDFVMLNTLHHRRDFMQKKDGRVAKFMPRFDGKYLVKRAWPDKSVYELDLPNHPLKFAKFHSSELKPYVSNDPQLFPNRTLPRPPPVVTEDGQEEWQIEKIIDQRRRGRGFQYLVRWAGYGPEEDRWIARSGVEECEALDIWLDSHPLPHT